MTPFETGGPPPPRPADDPRDVVTRQIEAPIKGSSDDELVRESVRALNRQRELGGDDPFAEQNAPVLERRYDGRDTGTKSLKQATKDLSDQHWIERPETEILRSQGWSDDQILALVKNENWLQSLGYTPQEAADYARRGEIPPMKVTPVRDDGRPARTLRDDEPVTLDHAFNSRSELKRGVANFRQAAASAQQQLLEQLSAA